jgi:hypothetical protein
MKAREKLLVAGTIGLGLLLVTAHLPRTGREPVPPVDAGAPVAEDDRPASVPAATLELVATGRAELKPLPAGMRNPFRPAANGATGNTPTTGDHARSTWERGAEKVAALRLTGILDEKVRLAALINGKPMRAGDRVTERGVVLGYRGELFFKKFGGKLQEPPDESRQPDEGAWDNEPQDTDEADS